MYKSHCICSFYCSMCVLNYDWVHAKHILLSYSSFFYHAVPNTLRPRKCRPDGKKKFPVHTAAWHLVLLIGQCWLMARGNIFSPVLLECWISGCCILRDRWSKWVLEKQSQPLSSFLDGRFQVTLEDFTLSPGTEALGHPRIFHIVIVVIQQFSNKCQAKWKHLDKLRNLWWPGLVNNWMGEPLALC